MEDEIFGQLQDFTPTEVKDDGDFKPIKGRYLARIARITHNIGVSVKTNENYDFYSMDLQIIETLEGDKGDRRYLRKRYNNNVDDLKKLMNDLFTASIEFDKSSREAFDLSLPSMIDKIVKVRAWSWTPEKKRDGTPIPEDERVAIQQFVVVKDFKKSKSISTENIPF